MARIATTTGQIMMYNLKSDRQVQYKAAEDNDFRHRYTMPHMAGTGLVMRRGGAKKKLIGMFANYGLCTPSVECLLLETSISNAVIRNMDKNNGVFISGNLSKGVFISFHLDNTDFAEDLYLATQSHSCWIPTQDWCRASRYAGSRYWRNKSIINTSAQQI